MDKLIAGTLFLIMLLSLVADPAPVSIEFWDIVLIFLPSGLGLVALASLKSYKMYSPESNLFIAIIIYLSYLLFSLLLGLLHGVAMLNVLRSIGPYLDFFPLLILAFLPIRLVNPWLIGIILISVGLLQAGYQLYLYFIHSYDSAGTFDVLRSRITFIDPRTTLPIVLSVAVLPMIFLSSKNNTIKFTAIFLIFLGLFAVAATLTRSTILSILLGWGTFIILFLYMKRPKHFLQKIAPYFFSSFIFIVLISSVPEIHRLEQGVWARFCYHFSSSGVVDYSNGRLYDEWWPALRTWANSGIFALFFGIGAGKSFMVASGEERTYIHNLVIYSLVYGGFYGLFACLWLYFTVFKTLLIRAWQTQQLIYLGFAALLISMFSYAQLFAVHKVLAFNAMLFLVMTVALSQPVKQN